MSLLNSSLALVILEGNLITQSLVFKLFPLYWENDLVFFNQFGEVIIVNIIL